LNAEILFGRRTGSSAVLVFEAAECYNAIMARPQRSGSELLNVLRGHEAELRARGVEALTVFGSVARGDAIEGSDVDLGVLVTEVQKVPLSNPLKLRI